MPSDDRLTLVVRWHAPNATCPNNGHYWYKEKSRDWYNHQSRDWGNKPVHDWYNTPVPGVPRLHG